MSPKIELEWMGEDRYQEWDDLVEDSDQGTIFHKSYWLTAVAPGSFGILGCYKGGRLWGGVPIVHAKKFGIKSSVHPALTPYLGIVLRNHDTKYVKRLSSERKIIEQIVQYLKARFRFVDIMFSTSFRDLIPFYRAGFLCTLKYTFVVKGLGELENVWRNMDETTRTDIRRAEKRGMRVVRGSEHFESVTNLVVQTLARKGKRPKFLGILEDLHRHLIDRQRCHCSVVMDDEDRIAAGAYLVWDDKRSYYLLGGHDSDKRHGGAAALGLWDAMKFTKEQLALDEFDFEGAISPALELFFRKFGGFLTPYYRAIWFKPLEISLYTGIRFHKLLRRK